MSALPLILALLAAQEAPAAPPQDPAPAASTEAPVDPLADMPFPAGAPRDDYGFVGWCAGALGGYLELHDKVLPDVTRIEAAFRKPGTTLAEDMKVYSDQQKEGRADLKAFARAMQAAENASLRPLHDQGLDAIQKGHATWAAAGNMPVRTVAQQWMGWALPARCEPTAKALEARARLLGATFTANDQSAPDAPAAQDAPHPPPALPAPIEATPADIGPAADAPPPVPADPAPTPAAPAAEPAPTRLEL